MFFFDANNYFFHKELSDDIKALQESKEFYKKEIKKDRVFINKMKDSSEMERFAREKYYLKKENEDIFIIEHQDSIK
jgi:cell division protein FtsB